VAKKKQRPRRILVLSGPNLQLLGKREPGVYGRKTLSAIHADLEKMAAELGVAVDCRQTNHEGALVDWIGSAPAEGLSGILINPGAYTHTSVALFDALKAAGLPAVEVHLSNPEAREPFRHRSFTAPACIGKVAGFGPLSYLLGLEALARHLSAKR
jgi:3-dehydroquinate dehydratase II